MIPYICTRDSKLRGFQFKLLHRRIAANDFLYKIGAIRHNICTFCNVAVETLEHLFWECSTTQTFWKECRLSEQSFSMATCLGLVPSPNILIDHILFMARYHIHVSKIKGTAPELYKLKYTISVQCQEN